MPTTLGLDLGPNSIGWALIDTDAQQIVDLGVRIFPEGVDNFDSSKEKPRNEARRDARMMRRQTRRRAERRRRLRQTLIDLGLFPAESEAQQALFDQGNSNPYALRAKALDEKLELHEIGRVLLHLNQRRGFRSNKKSQDTGSKETQGMLGEMGELEQELQNSGARTYGEYIHQETAHLTDAESACFIDKRIRGRHTQRRWLTGLDAAERERADGDLSRYFCPDGEFDAIWKAQAKHYPDLLTDQLAYGKLGRLKDIHKPIPKNDPADERRNGESDLESFGLFGLIFFHRTLKPVPKDVVGLCELEPKQRRCHRADRAAQRFRLLQEVNNLRMLDSSASPPVERPLHEQERAFILDKLTQTKEASFDQIRKWVAKLPDSPAEEQIKFNLEEGKRKKLQGMVTDALLAGNKAVGKAWWKIEDERRDAIVRCLIDSLDDDATHHELVNTHGLTPDQADGALSIDLTAGPTKGYLNYSRVAIEKLLPHLAKGMRVMANDASDSAIHAAGYLRRDQLQQRVFDKLPDLKRVQNLPIGDIPNPVVKRAIVELRKVVNAIIRQHGRPDAVHVEMARDVQQGPKQRGEYTSKMREREAERDAAKKFLDERGQRYGAGGNNILRVLLWEQQNHICPYSGQKISQAQLFNDGLIDIDHILPYKRSLDDSQMNKVVCFREANADKRDQTPYEWKADRDPAGFEAIQQYTRHLPYPKRKRFIQKELELDDFVARQLNTTSYIAKATAEYLKCLFTDEENKRGVVLGLKGQLTSELRRQWHLNHLLRNDEQDTKSRDDHRHHAVDAVVIALTDQSRLHRLAKGRREVEGVDRETGEVKHYSAYLGRRIEEPWDTFGKDVAAKINMLDGGQDEQGQQRGVSHRVQRKVSGALHEETVYAPTYDDLGNRQVGTFAIRKEITDLTASTVEDICDSRIQKLIKQRLIDAGIEFGWGKSKWDKKIQANLGEVGNPLIMPPSKKRLKEYPNAKGVPVKKIRIFVKNQTIQPIRTDQAEKQNDPDRIAYVKPGSGSTHHLCIFEFMHKGKKKRDAVFVTQLEATNRLKRQQQELTKQVTQWQEQGLNKHEIKRKQIQAMRQIAADYPLIQHDAAKLTGEDRQRIPASARFVMSLSKREMVILERSDKKLLLTMRKVSGKRIVFVTHLDSRDSQKRLEIRISPKDYDKLRKVTVTPLGRIRWAND